MQILASPNGWVAWPEMAAMVLLLWAIINFIQRTVKRSRANPPTEMKRGFEVLPPKNPPE